MSMIRLETADEKDFNKIIEWTNCKSSDFLLQWAGNVYKFPLTIQQMKEDYSNGFNMVDSATYLYKILLMEANEMIGTVQICKVDRTNKSAFIGRFLIGKDDMRNRGYGTTALNELVKIGFVVFGLNTLKLKVFDFNESAIRCYGKVGFVKQNYFKDVCKTENGYWSEYEMVLNKDDWKDKNYNSAISYEDYKRKNI